MKEQKIQQNEDFKKKEQTYRGKTIENLKNLDIREFAELLKSNEKRTLMRQYGEVEKFLIRFNKKILKGKQIKTHQRELVIVPKMVGLRINVHNGKEFVPIDITIDMLGHRLGEFSVTRQKVKHGAAGIGATRSSASASVK
jgi:small subunit ribosomal protein S19